jgi:LytR cell envelope-related transcriptional attenuator
VDLVERVGSYVGLAAFLGLAVLALLYFSQARDVRRLREWAGRAPERASETAASGVPTAQTPAARHGLPPLSLAEHDARPRKRLRERLANVHIPRPPHLPYLAGAVVLLLLLGGGTYAGIQLLGDSDDSGTAKSASPDRRSNGGSDSGGKSERVNVNPAQVTVAVLNGTTVQGLAAKVGEEVDAAGFTPGTIGNAARIDQTRSQVLYSKGQSKAARAVANRLGIKGIAPVDSVNQEIAGSFDAVVLVGSDRQ